MDNIIEIVENKILYSFSHKRRLHIIDIAIDTVNKQLFIDIWIALFEPQAVLDE